MTSAASPPAVCLWIPRRRSLGRFDHGRTRWSTPSQSSHYTLDYCCIVYTSAASPSSPGTCCSNRSPIPVQYVHVTPTHHLQSPLTESSRLLSDLISSDSTSYEPTEPWGDPVRSGCDQSERNRSHCCLVWLLAAMINWVASRRTKFKWNEVRWNKWYEQ